MHRGKGRQARRQAKRRGTVRRERSLPGLPRSTVSGCLAHDHGQDTLPRSEEFARSKGCEACHEEAFPLGEPATALGQLHELRKYDEAARVRNRADVLLQIDLTDQLTFAASYGTTQDDYHESLYGLLSDINHNYRFDLTYSPRPEISLFADYGREKYRYLQRSRQRTPTNDSPNNDWESGIRDLVDTWGAGLNLFLFRKHLLADTYYSL